jgi:hypothetical protein
MLCAILGVVHEPSRHFLGSISIMVPGVVSFIQWFDSLYYVGVAASFVASALPANKAFMFEMAHGDGRGSQLPLPRSMKTVAGSHWVSVVNK